MSKFISISLHSVSSKFALFLIGVLLGAGLTMPFSYHKIHLLTQKIHSLETEKSTLNKQVAKYEEMLPRRGTVQTDRIILLFRNEVPDYVKSSVEREIINRLSPHIGKELAKLDPLLLEQALDGQIFVVEQTQWEVQVRSIRITDRLEFTLELEEK